MPDCYPTGMTDAADTLQMTDNIGIRLQAVEFPNGREAIVTFELFSWPAANGGEQHSLAKIPQCTRRLLNHDETIDYGGIVREAGAKLTRDFERVIDTLSNHYRAGADD